jgi:hypothetical protein
MRNYWPLILAVASLVSGQSNNTVLGAQATPSPPSSEVEATEAAFQAQGGGQGSTSTIRVTVTSPKTCPHPSTLTKTVTSSVGYPADPPKTVTVTSISTKEVTKSGGHSATPPKTITVTKSDTHGSPPRTITVTSPGYCEVLPPLTVTHVINSTITKVLLFSSCF